VTSAHALMSLALSAVDRAVEVIRTSRPGLVTTKGDRDMASEVDYRVEREVRAWLAGQAPDIGFLGEEQGGSGSATRFWVLDPVDGTANFVHGIPLCAVSLALIEHDIPTLGVIDLPLLDGNRYTVQRGAGAYSNGRRIRVNQVDVLHDAIVSIGDYAVGADAERKNRLRLAVTEQLAARAQRVRMLGTAAVDLAWVADGKLDASIILANKPWDTAAGALLAQEAGARVIGRDGAAHSLESDATIACAPGLVDEITALLDGARRSTSA
jgi:myo-inositol-1(or 4)-monophosphatase